MIVGFADTDLQRLYEQSDRSGIGLDIIGRVETLLARLDASSVVQDMKIATYRIRPVSTEQNGPFAAFVSPGWLLCFRFENGRVHDVALRRRRES